MLRRNFLSICMIAMLMVGRPTQAAELPPIGLRDALRAAQQLFAVDKVSDARGALDAAISLSDVRIKPEDALALAAGLAIAGREPARSELLGSAATVVTNYRQLMEGLRAGRLSSGWRPIAVKGSEQTLCRLLAITGLVSGAQVAEAIAAAELAEVIEKQDNALKSCLLAEVIPNLPGAPSVGKFVQQIAPDRPVLDGIARQMILEGRGEEAAELAASGDRSTSEAFARAATKVRQLESLGLKEPDLQRAILSNWLNSEPDGDVWASALLRRLDSSVARAEADRLRMGLRKLTTPAGRHLATMRLISHLGLAEGVVFLGSAGIDASRIEVSSAIMAAPDQATLRQFLNSLGRINMPGNLADAYLAVVSRATELHDDESARRATMQMLSLAAKAPDSQLAELATQARTALRLSNGRS